MKTIFEITASPKHHESQIWNHANGVWMARSRSDGEGCKYATQGDAEADLEFASEAWGEYADLDGIRVSSWTYDDEDGE